GQERNKDPQYIQQLQALQAKLQNLDRQRREVLAQMQQLLGRSETLQELLQQELGGWQERQRRLCLGGPGDTNLRPLEAWFTELGQGLFQLRQLLRTLNDLRQKVTYERDPLVAETPLLEQRLQEQLTHLLKSAFVVEQQPSTPNAAKRPLVLRTASKFSARARLLVRLHDRNHRMEAKIHIDRSPNLSPPAPQGYPEPHLPSLGGILSPQPLRGLGALGGLGRPGGLGTASLTPVPSPQTTTLPFIIISNNNQFSSAWASILWFNMLSSDPKAQQFFSSPPPAPWPRLAEVLSWQFESVAERGLSQDNLLMLAKKLLG
ncbi:STAT2 protein, partial [Melanocharis versteri]|nr:STAT2 protein [Melanocharis versteri]